MPPRKSRRKRIRTIDADWDAVAERLRRREAGELRGLRTGFGSLDKLLSGLHGVTVIGGAPGVGKTTLALQLAAHVAELNGVPVHWATWEMQRGDVIERLAARLARVGGGDLKDKFRALGKLITVSYSQRDLSAAAGSMVSLMRHRDASTGLLVVDSLQALVTHASPLGADNTKLAIDRMLTDAYDTAYSEGFALLFISRVPKGAEGRAAAFTFSGSGGIDYLVDTTAQLLGDEADADEAVIDRELHIIKSRFGRRGVIELDFHPAEHRFEVRS